MFDLTDSALLMLKAGGIVLLVSALPAVFCYLRLRARHAGFFPPTRRWVFPWDGWMIVMQLFLVYFFVTVIVSSLVLQSGFLQAIYGPEFVFTKASKDITSEQQAANNLIQLWIAALAFPVQVVVFLLLIRADDSKNWRKALGLSLGAFRSAVPLGVLIWSVLTPLVFLVYMLINAILLQVFNATPEQHPATRLGGNKGVLEWALFCFQAGLIAPIVEETLFRGLILPWTLQRGSKSQSPPPLIPCRQRAFLLYVIAIAFAALNRSEAISDCVKAGNWAKLPEILSPVFFILVLLPVLILVPRAPWPGRKVRLRSARSGRAVIANAVLFAGIHSTWPSPVPLFFLGLGLAWLAVRTRSILAPILVHMLFNSVSVVYLLLGGKP